MKYICPKCKTKQNSFPCSNCSITAKDSMTITNKIREIVTYQTDDWENKFRQKYEGANVWSSKSIDDVIAFIKQLLKDHNKELCERIEGRKKTYKTGDLTRSNVGWGLITGWNDALHKIQQLIKERTL